MQILNDADTTSISGGSVMVFELLSFSQMNNLAGLFAAGMIPIIIANPQSNAVKVGALALTVAVKATCNMVDNYYIYQQELNSIAI